MISITKFPTVGINLSNMGKLFPPLNSFNGYRVGVNSLFYLTHLSQTALSTFSETELGGGYVHSLSGLLELPVFSPVPICPLKYESL